MLNLSIEINLAEKAEMVGNAYSVVLFGCGNKAFLVFYLFYIIYKKVIYISLGHFVLGIKLMIKALLLYLRFIHIIVSEIRIKARIPGFYTVIARFYSAVTSACKAGKLFPMSLRVKISADYKRSAAGHFFRANR